MLVQLDLWSVAAEPVLESEAPVYDEGVPNYIPVDDAAERLGVGRQRIYEFIKAKRLKAIKDPETRTWLISEESVIKFQRRGKGGRPRKKRTSY